MNTTLLFSVLLFSLTATFKANAQAQKLTSRVVNPDHTLRTPNSPSAPGVAPHLATAPTIAPAAPIVIPEKTKEQKDEMLRKTIEFQKKRAAAGAPSAQYDLGMRYLNGEGVEKDRETAMKWLNASATNGNSQAVKKLEELKKK